MIKNRIIDSLRSKSIKNNCVDCLIKDEMIRLLKEVVIILNSKIDDQDNFMSKGDIKK